MYGHLPDYEEFHGYDLGIDSELSQTDGMIYADFRKPSWGASGRHLFSVGIPKKLYRRPGILAGGGKERRI